MPSASLRLPVALRALELRDDQRYINLAGEAFREEAELLERRLWGLGAGRERGAGRRVASKSASKIAPWSLSRQTTGRLSFWLNGAAQESNLPSLGLPDLTGFEDRLGHRARPLHQTRYRDRHWTSSANRTAVLHVT